MKKILLVIMGILVAAGVVCNADEQTSIVSDRLEMEMKGQWNVFNFYKNVELTSKEMHATCDRLRIVSRKSEGSDTLEMEGVKRITAVGNVRIEQDGRVATGGKAEIFPKEGKIVLEENPVVVDKHGEVTGHRIVFYRGSNKAHVEGGPSGERPTITLSNMPELPTSKEIKK